MADEILDALVELMLFLPNPDPEVRVVGSHHIACLISISCTHEERLTDTASLDSPRDDRGVREPLDDT